MKLVYGHSDTRQTVMINWWYTLNFSFSFTHQKAWVEFWSMKQAPECEARINNTATRRDKLKFST